MTPKERTKKRRKSSSTAAASSRKRIVKKEATMPVPIVKRIRFSAEGGTIKVALTFNTMLLCTYELDLREVNKNASVPPFPVKGDNTNSQDDEYYFPMPVSSNDGRNVLAFINLMDQNGTGGTYQCKMIFSQDGSEIGCLDTGQTPQSGNVSTVIFAAKLVRS